MRMLQFGLLGTVSLAYALLLPFPPSPSHTYGLALPDITHQTLSPYAMLSALEAFHLRHHGPSETPGVWFAPLSAAVQKRCLTGTRLTYTVSNVEIGERQHAASNCSVNHRHPGIEERVVISPNVVSETQLPPTDLIQAHLQQSIIKAVQAHIRTQGHAAGIPPGTLKVPSARFGQLSPSAPPPPVPLPVSFYAYDLDYSLRCEVNHYDIVQVVLQTTVLRLQLTETIHADSSCGLGTGGDTSLVVEIPITGNFECRAGRTKTCKRETAQSV